MANRTINCTIINNKPLNKSTYLMEFKVPSTKWCEPGKFINIQVPGKYLRRPMSVYDWTKNTLKIIYKVIGEGTKILSNMKKGEKINVLTDLGNWYCPYPDDKQLIVCGGCGIGSVYVLGKELTKQGIDVTMVVGFKSKADVFTLPEWKKACKKLIITTDDGSVGFKGNVVDAIKHYKLANLPYYSCGSINLMKAVFKACKNNGELSLEARMGCGYGCCMGCSIQTKNGPRRICKEGPIFASEDLLW